MCHVWIAEDQTVIAMDVQDLLEREGASFFAFAVSEEDAIKEALNHTPALVTSDVKLVAGTGPNAITKIYEHWLRYRDFCYWHARGLQAVSAARLGA